MTHLLEPLLHANSSSTLLINERSADLIAEGKEVFRLGFGQSPFPVPSIVVQSLMDNAHQKDYLPVSGLPALREVVARHAMRTLDITVDEDQVAIGPGSKELIFGVQLALHADLLLPSPSWVSYEPQAKMLRKPIHWLETQESDNWKLKPETISQSCKNISSTYKLLILNYPNNPTGVTYSGQELHALVNVLRDNNIIVIADEIYGEVDHNNSHVSLSKYYPEGTIVSAGLSKWCGAGGWRLGTFIFPKELDWLQRAMRVIASETFSAVAAPIQYAAVCAFTQHKEIDLYLKRSRAILKTVGNYVHAQLKDMNIHCPKPEGGFYIFPNFNHYKEQLQEINIETSEALCHYLLDKTGIALLPGSAFGRPKTELTTRLAYVDFDGTALLHVIEKEGSFDIYDHCPKIVGAMTTLNNWIKTLFV